MKTKILAACALLGGLFMASCNEQGQHQLLIAYPAQGYSILYADETIDSISFLTFDSWRVIPRESEWIRLTGDDHGNIKHDDTKRYWITCELQFKQNNTNATRLGTVEVFSYEYSVGANYLQYGHLEISHPAPDVVTLRPGSTIPETVSFCVSDSAFVRSDSLCFRVRDRWKLTCKDNAELPSWVTLSKTEGTMGKHKIDIAFEENLSVDPRSVVLQLTSGNVTNDIKIEQLGRKLKEDEE